MSILNDREIWQLSRGRSPILSPFVEKSVKQDEAGNKLMSYGLQPFGYDIRLGTVFKVLSSQAHNEVGIALDPKKVNQELYDEVEYNQPFVLYPGHSITGVSLEMFNMPSDITGFSLQKSSYTRNAIHVNISAIDGGWSGYLTMSITNHNLLPVKIYPNEGITQICFFRGLPPVRDYSTKGGNYQNATGVRLD